MNRRFIRSIAILSGSNLVAQAINFATYLILPRYFYSPDEFGVFGLFLAVYYILFEVVNLKMDQSVMLPESDHDALGLLGFSWTVAAVVSGIAIIGLLGLNALIGDYPPLLAALLGLSLLLGGLVQPAMVYLNRQRAYGQMGYVRILQALSTLAASIGAWYWLQGTMNGLVAGFIAGQVIAAVIIVLLTWNPGIHVAGRTVTDRYNQFIRYGSLSAMVSTLSRNLPVFMLKPVFGDAALGWYTVASKYLNAPIGIFSVSIGQVYYKDASRLGPEDLRKLTRKVVLNILGLAVFPVLIALLFGEDIFGWLLGPEWRPAGLMLQVLVLWYFIAYATGPVSMLLDVKLKLDWELWYNISLLFGRGLALFSVLIWRDVYWVLGAYTAVGIIFNLILLNYVLRLSGRSE